MKNVKVVLIPAILIVVTAVSMAVSVNNKKASKTEFKLLTTVESVVPGGFGRSRMIVSDKDGKLQETKLENFYSLVGINFGNINENNKEVTRKIQDLYAEGWELANVSTGVQSGNEGGNATGIFITRYLFKKQVAE